MTTKSRFSTLVRTAVLALALLAAVLPASVPAHAEDVTFTALSAGAFHTCALTSTGEVMCWGENTSSQLGSNASGSYSATPVAVGSLAGVTAIDGGGLFTCALTAGGAVSCWGGNSAGQLGNGSTSTSSLPAPVAGLSSGVTAISAGTNHTCALTSSGGVQCWGLNNHGQLGDGSTSNRATPVAVTGLDSGVLAVSAGSFHTCAVLAAGDVKCWGLNQSGQLGNGLVFYQSPTPVDVLDLGAAMASISAGYAHTCGVTSSGAGKCWGLGYRGQLGDGSGYGGEIPVDVDATTTGAFGAIDASQWEHTCGLTQAGGAFCWGANEFGQLGNGDFVDSFVPAPVSGLGSGIVAVSAGSLHACALTAAGTVKCWGANSAGQLGNGTTTDSNVPVDVVFPANQDTTAPSIAISAPTATTYLLNQPVTAAYTCDDGAGSGVQACVGSVANGAAIDTASAGSKTFTVNATDYAGNTASQSLTYGVGYAFSGFLQPIDNPNTVNTGRAGRTYPVKWQLLDANGAPIGSLAAVSSITYQPTACSAFGSAPSDPLATAATGGTSLRYDATANQYVYNWATPQAPGCYTLFLALDSGQVFPAFFQLR